MMNWTDYPEMKGPVVKRWLHNDSGDIISVVTGDNKKNIKIGIDGEIRCSIDSDCFIIPCSLNVVARKTNSELIQVAERMAGRRRYFFGVEEE